MSEKIKERPIVFTEESVRAILAGRKTQTRRVIKPVPDGVGNKKGILTPFVYKEVEIFNKNFQLEKLTHHPKNGQRLIKEIKCPYGIPGDRLWIKEPWRTEELESGLDGARFRADNYFQVIKNTMEASEAWADAHHKGNGLWRSSRFMPRWASRVLLEVANIRVQRVQDISIDEVDAEGWPGAPDQITDEIRYSNQVDQGFYWFSHLWDKINAKRGYGWDVNPWVWAVEFKELYRDD